MRTAYVQRALHRNLSVSSDIGVHDDEFWHDANVWQTAKYDIMEGRGQVDSEVSRCDLDPAFFHGPERISWQLYNRWHCAMCAFHNWQ